MRSRGGARDRIVVVASVKEGVDSAERARKPRTRRKAGSSADAIRVSALKTGSCSHTKRSLACVTNGIQRSSGSNTRSAASSIA